MASSTGHSTKPILINPTLRALHERIQDRRAARPGLHHVADKIADVVTRFSGSMVFVALHIAWFGSWIIINTVSADPFDAFPFGLLTLIVSLEAIFLNSFILISQNRQSARTEQRVQLEFLVNVYSGALSEVIARKVGVDFAEVQAEYATRVMQAREHLENGQ